MRVSRYLLFALATFALASVALADGAQVHLESTPSRRLPLTRNDVLWQARSCVGESGWDDHETCIAMAWVHYKRARILNHRFETMVRTYSFAVREGYQRRRPWLLHLRYDGHEPDEWYARLPWRRYKDRWLTMLDEVKAWAKGERPDPCPTALHYGGRTIDAQPTGYVDAGCLPESEQIFWARPEQLEEASETEEQELDANEPVDADEAAGAADAPTERTAPADGHAG